MSPNPFIENFLLWALFFGLGFFLCRFLKNKWGQKGKSLFLFLSLFCLVRYFLFGHMAAWNFFLNHAQDLKKNQRVIDGLKSVLLLEARYRTSQFPSYLFVGGSYMEAALYPSRPPEIETIKQAGFSLIEVFTLERFFRKLRPKAVIFLVGISEFTYIRGGSGEYFYLDSPDLLKLPFLSRILLQEGFPPQGREVFRDYLLDSLFPEKRVSPLYLGLLEELKNYFFYPQNYLKNKEAIQAPLSQILERKNAFLAPPSTAKLYLIIQEHLAAQPTLPPSPPSRPDPELAQKEFGEFGDFSSVEINIQAFSRFLQGLADEDELKFIMVEGVINPKCNQVENVQELRKYFSQQMAQLARTHQNFHFIPWERPSPFGEDDFSDCFHLVKKKNSWKFMKELAHLLEKHQI